VDDRKEAAETLKNILYDLYSDGYLTAGYDSLHFDSISATATLYMGRQYRWALLNTSYLDPVLINEIKYKAKYFNGQSVTGDDLSRLTRQIVNHYEDHGYPFAMVKLDSLDIIQGELSASLSVDKGPMIVMDSMTVKGSSKLKTSYLRNYLDIKPGQLYNENKVKKVESKLSELQFAREIRPYEIGFTEEKANLILYLEKNRASQFDGIIGVAPNDVTSGKVLITGDIKLKLASIFNRGEILDFNWRRIEAQTQDLKIRLQYPFLFSTPFGVDYRFWLLKQDTSFISLNNNIGIQYLFESNHYLKTFFEAFNSSLLSTSGYETITELPEFADVKSSTYGLEYSLLRVDYIFNPRKGFTINILGSYGTRKISKNTNINPDVYDSIKLENNIFRTGGQIELYIPLFRRGSFLVATDVGYIDSDNLFQNEMYRIGGLKSLRGFDEESIFASLYTIMKAEFRYLFEKDSYFTLFWNGAYYENSLNQEMISDTPWGFGTGVSFRTGAGIFSVFYALGRQFDNPFDLRSAKIHFGYTSVF